MTSFRDQIKKQLAPTHVSIVEFAESTDFVGKRLFPAQRVLLKLIFLEEMEGWEEDLLTHWIDGGRNGEVLISPQIRERRDLCRERGYSHFSEIDLVGGRRSSKGHVTGIAGTYKLWTVQQIPDPGSYFGIDVDKVIDFSCIAASFDQAKTTQFADFYSDIKSCKALLPYISKMQEESITVRTDSDDLNIAEMKALGLKVNRDWAKLRVRPIAANADTLRGSANIFIDFDEMAKMLPGESKSSAMACYTAAEPSLAQFGPNALIFCKSSPHTKVGQFYEQWELSMRPEGHVQHWYPMRFALEFPSWAAFDFWWLDPKPPYRSAKDDKIIEQPIMVSPDWPDQLDPDIPESKLNTFSVSQREHEQLQEYANPETYKVERRAQWAEVLDAYLDPIKVDMAYRMPDGSACRKTNGGIYEYSYRAHVDPSSTTAGFGYAIAHVEEYPDGSGMFPDGIARHVVFDKVHRWDPKSFPGHTINYIKVREDLTKDMKLFQFAELSCDQYQSSGLIWELREEARKLNLWNCQIHEITATAALNWNRFETFRTALNLGLVHLPEDCIDEKGFNHSEWAKLELKFLQEVQTGQTKRVDKQEMGPITTKDVADAIVICTYKFLSSYISDFGNGMLQKLRPQYGAEAGYQIGGKQQGGPMGGFEPRRGFDDFYARKGAYNNPSRARGINPNRRRSF